MKKLNKKNEVTLLAGFCFIFFILCSIRAGVYSLWLDELITCHIADTTFGEYWARLKADVHGPLFHTCLYFLLKTDFFSEYLVRLPAIISGTLTIPAVYIFCKTMHLKRYSFLACSMLCLSPFFIEYSREVHPYSLSALMVVLSWLFYLHLLKKPTIMNAAFYSLANGFVFLSLYVACCAIFPQVLLTLFLKIRFKKRGFIFGGWFGSVLIILPWLPYFWHQVNHVRPGTAVYYPDGFRLEHISLFIFDLSFGSYPVFESGLIKYFFASLILIYLIWLFVYLKKSLIIQKIFTGSLIGILLTFILVNLSYPIIISRHLTCISPFIFVAFVIGLQQIELKYGMIAFLVFCGISIPGLVYYHQEMPRENWRENALYLSENFNNQSDVILCADLSAKSCLQYYLIKLGHKDTALRVYTFEQAFPGGDFSAANSYLHKFRKLWLLEWHYTNDLVIRDLIFDSYQKSDGVLIDDKIKLWVLEGFVK